MRVGDIVKWTVKGAKPEEGDVLLVGQMVSSDTMTALVTELKAAHRVHGESYLMSGTMHEVPIEDLETYAHCIDEVHEAYERGA